MAPSLTASGNSRALFSPAAPPLASSPWTTSSASWTGTPRRRKLAAAVDLPMPIDPVRPRITIRSSVETFQHEFPERRRHLRLYAEPAVEAGPRLMQQHAEAIDGLVATRGGDLQQRRFERRLDDVGDDGVLRQRPEIEIEQPLALHTEAGGIDQ